jgi:propanediol dehydratase small subunit
LLHGGIITREEGKLKLSERGLALARQPERDSDVFLEIVDLMRPYRSAMEWAHHQGMESLDANDVAAH